MADASDPAWVSIQKQTFTRWVHLQLDIDADGDGEIDDDKIDDALPLEEVFKTGTNLITVLEKHSGQSLGRSYKNPKLKVQQLDNLSTAFKFMRENGIKLVNISNEDVWNGNSKLICGLVWTIIYEFQLSRMDIDGKQSPKEALLEWIQSKIPEEGIKNLLDDWRDGRAICALTNALGKELYGTTLIDEIAPGDAKGNAAKGINAAHKKLGVAKLLTPDVVTNPDCDEHSMVAYLSMFKGYHVPAETAEEREARLQREAERIAAEKAALVAEEERQLQEAARIQREADEHRAAQEAAAAKAEADARAKAEAEAAAAKAKAEAEALAKAEAEERDRLVEEARLKAEAEAAAAAAEEARLKNPPPMEREKDTWRTYNGVDLGGRCRIRVYYSTTTSNNTIRLNSLALQKLLEAKGVHLRPDFEPWVPVDIDMERDFRNMIFEKAGQRETPMLFVDDEFAGGYDRCVELNDSGELDRILAY